MPTSYLIGNSQVITRTFNQKLVFEHTGGTHLLDCSVGFQDEDVVTARSYSNLIHTIPGRAQSHVHGGTQEGIIGFSFRVPVWTLDGKEFENSVDQILDFFDAAPGGLVRIYWVKDDVNAYYAYLDSCLITGLSAVRKLNRRHREVSYVEMSVQSLSKGWTKVFSGDTAPAAIVARGPWIHTASTNDGSVCLAVIRESDQQALFELDDQGTIRTLKNVKTNQDLTAWDLDLDEL